MFSQSKSRGRCIIGKKSAPESPDPKETASAQTGTNLATAQANAVLGNVNQYTPYGSIEYTQTGSQFINDANGQTYYVGPDGKYSTSKPGLSPIYSTTPAAKPTYGGMPNGHGGSTNISKSGQVVGPGAAATKTITGYTLPKGYSEVKGYYVPQYSATTKLSEAQQKILDQTQGAQYNLAKTANERSDWLSEYLKTPLTLESANATREQTLDALMKRLQPSLDAQDQANQTQLNNAGIKAGSDAYGRSRDEINRNAVDARLAAILASGQEAQNQYALESAARNAPLNEIIGLMNGSQVQSPQAAATNMPSIPTVDYAGLVQQDYQNKLGAWQQKQAMTSNILGGIFGLGASILKSDIAAKKNIEPIGMLPNGLGVYRFHYVEQNHDEEKTVGVMAQEVLRVIPEAVLSIGGVLHVDYARVL